MCDVYLDKMCDVFRKVLRTGMLMLMKNHLVITPIAAHFRYRQ